MDPVQIDLAPPTLMSYSCPDQKRRSTESFFFVMQTHHFQTMSEGLFLFKGFAADQASPWPNSLRIAVQSQQGLLGSFWQ
jgi:hypothetical protein